MWKHLKWFNIIQSDNTNSVVKSCSRRSDREWPIALLHLNDDNTHKIEIY